MKNIIRNTASVHQIPSNRPMSVAWMLCAIFLFGIACLPWIVAAFKVKSNQLNAIPILIMSIWSVLPVALGTYLIFIALCRIEFTGTEGIINRHATLLGIQRTRIFDNADRVHHVKRRRYSRHGATRPVASVFIRSGGRKRLLTNELHCPDLPALFAWCQQVANIKGIDIDAMHRLPVG